MCVCVMRYRLRCLFADWLSNSYISPRGGGSLYTGVGHSLTPVYKTTPQGGIQLLLYKPVWLGVEVIVLF